LTKVYVFPLPAEALYILKLDANTKLNLYQNKQS